MSANSSNSSYNNITQIYVSLSLLFSVLRFMKTYLHKPLCSEAYGFNAAVNVGREGTLGNLRY